jgi:hypothetical protein
MTVSDPHFPEPLRHLASSYPQPPRACVGTLHRACRMAAASPATQTSPTGCSARAGRRNASAMRNAKTRRERWLWEPAFFASCAARALIQS